MATAKDEFFVKFKNWLVIGGMITRSACGRITRRICKPFTRPSALAASDWPRDTDWMPPRTTSATKAEV